MRKGRADMIRFSELLAINDRWTTYHMLIVCFMDSGKCEILPAGYVNTNYGEFKVCSFECDTVYLEYQGGV